MQELVIRNVKTTEYRDVNMNKIFDPDGTHCQTPYEFQISDVVSPYKSGEGKLCVTFYTLESGKANYPFHQHTGIEEVFYIISGTATLQTPKGDFVVSEGDVIVMPPNENGAHKLTNHSDKPLVYLDVDTVDTHEVVFYPDTQKFRVMANGFAKTFRMDSDINHLEGE